MPVFIHCRRSADNGSVNQRLLLVSAAAALGCGAPTAAGPPASAPVAAVPEQVQGLRVHVADNIAIVAEGDTNARIGEALKAAVQAELARQGVRVLPGNDRGVDLTVRIETRVRGAVYFLRGHVGLTVEKAGVSVASAATDDEIHRESEFPSIMAAKAVASLLRSPALTQFADRHAPRSREPVRVKPTLRPAPVVARAPSPETLAKTHYGRATSYYNLGRYREALAEYEAAYLAVQDPPFLFNIAQCQRKMGRDKEALGAYRSYLRVAPNAPNRSDVRRWIAELERETRPLR
jgi:tetratricopeptide (TPR) repeat protein